MYKKIEYFLIHVPAVELHLPGVTPIYKTIKISQ